MGGSGGGDTNSVSKYEPPPWTEPYWEGLGSSLGGLTSQSLPRYQGMSVAPLTPQFGTAADMTYNLATGGNPSMRAGQENVVDTLQGLFADPYAQEANPFMGSSPQFEQSIQDMRKSAEDSFGRTTAAQTDAAAARAHAYGGSAHTELQTANAKALADQLGTQERSMRDAQFQRSGQLADSALNRASGAVQQERGRQMTAAGLAPQYQASDLSSIAALLGIGDTQRGYQQSLIDSAKQDFGSYVMDPFQRADVMGAFLTRAGGGAGTTSQQIMGGQYSPLLGAAGAGMAGLGLYRGLMG